MKGRGSVGDGVHTPDRFVKCTILGDILDNDELETITVISEFIDEKGAFRQGANCAADRVACFQVLLDDPSGEIAICTSDENLGWGRDGDHG